MNLYWVTQYRLPFPFDKGQNSLILSLTDLLLIQYQICLSTNNVMCYKIHFCVLWLLNCLISRESVLKRSSRKFKLLIKIPFLYTWRNTHKIQYSRILYTILLHKNLWRCQRRRKTGSFLRKKQEPFLRNLSMYLFICLLRSIDYLFSLVR